MPEMHRHEIDEVTCREFVELVTDYWEGALPEERMELVEEHLVMCDWCKTYLEQMQATVDALPEAAEREPVPEETERVLLSAFREWKARR
ncbi:MAG TPA: zf-HC2 domain-containing protein [Solirubrobacterales bacterium]|nr:zf-HC2 domain-containing protein [Solirubrobacterales bacterium]